MARQYQVVRLGGPRASVLCKMQMGYGFQSGWTSEAGLGQWAMTAARSSRRDGLEEESVRGRAPRLSASGVPPTLRDAECWQLAAESGEPRGRDGATLRYNRFSS